MFLNDVRQRYHCISHEWGNQNRRDAERNKGLLLVEDQSEPGQRDQYDNGGQELRCIPMLNRRDLWIYTESNRKGKARKEVIDCRAYVCPEICRSRHHLFEAGRHQYSISFDL